MSSALRIRDFRLLWTARLISDVGSWLLVVAVPAHVFALTGSVTATGLTLAAQFLPPAVLGPFAGVLADRVDRRHVMVAADLARAVAVASLLLVRGPGDLWLVYGALAAESVGTVLFGPAASAQTPAVVGTGEALSSANALNAGTDGTVRLVGGPLGGLLYAWAGFPLLVWLDVASYLVSAAAVAGTARSPGRGSDRPGFVWSTPFLRALLLVQVLFLGANASLSALLIPYGITVLGGSSVTGLLMSALGIGFLLGAPLTRLLVDRAAPAVLLGAALVGTGLGYVLLFSARSVAGALPAAVLIGMSGSTVLSGAQTTLQRVTPDEVLGRASSLLVTAEAVATLAGALLGPAVAQRSSIAATAVLAATVTAVTGVVALFVLPRRRLDAHRVDRVPIARP